MEILQTKEAFKTLVENIKESTPNYKDPIGFGIARVDLGQINIQKTLQATYPIVNWNENFGSAAIFIKALSEQGVEVDFSESEVIYDINTTFLKSCLNAFTPYLDEAYGDSHKNIQVVSTLYNQITHSGSLEGEFKVTFIFADEELRSVETTYLKLYALSQAKTELISINLDGALNVLPNLAWSNTQPIELEYLREFEIELKLANEYPHIDFVDKFPRFLQHIIPEDKTTIIDASKVRLGAQLAAGTNVMAAASYVDLNAGTTGAVTIEGRIPSSVIVGEGSTIKDGASIVKSDENPISIGKNTYLGANSFCGIGLGSESIIDAGLAILEETNVGIYPSELVKIQEANKGLTMEGEVFKAKDLAGLNALHFRQNSLTGEITASASSREKEPNKKLN